MRKLVALFFHLPGLRLLYGAKATPSLVRTNLKAVAATLVLMGGAGLSTAPAQRLTAVIAVWLVGHFAWGTYLATKA
jgi:hypothetical protein